VNTLQVALVGLVVVASLALTAGTLIAVRRRQQPAPDSDSRERPIWYRRIEIDEDPIVAAIGLAPDAEPRRRAVGVARTRTPDDGEGP
jgi:hypothetical protein